MPKIQISYPNDYGSEQDDQRAVEDLRNRGLIGEGSDEDDIGAAMLEDLADCARDAGLTHAGDTDFGAIWQGTPEQVAACREALPGWAYVAEIEE